MNPAEFSLEELSVFITNASKATYMGGGKKEETPERPNFTELIYSKGEFTYRDSYTGFYRSWGTETVRHNNKPAWVTMYGGGMEKGKEDLALETFNFLKKAISNKEESSRSFRGPNEYSKNEWGYSYKQTGNISNFSGEEEIYYKDELVFTHKIIGGLVIDQQ